MGQGFFTATPTFLSLIFSVNFLYYCSMKKLLLLLLCVPLIGFSQQYTPNNPMYEKEGYVLLRSFIQSPEINPEIHEEYWKKIIDNELSIDEVMGFQEKELKEVMTFMSVGMKLVYEDALISLENGEPFMSKSRQEWYNNDIVTKHQRDVDKNKGYNIIEGHTELIEKILQKEPIYVSLYDEYILFTEEIINEIIVGLDQELVRIEKRISIMYDRNYFKK